LEDNREAFGIERCYTDAEEMLAKESLDAVSVAVPNKFHAPLTLAALESGCHVLCEKPMAMNVAEAEQMAAAARTAGKVLMINFSFRFNAASYALKERVDSGEVGEIYFGRTVWHRWRGMPGFGGWFGNKALSGGGPLIDLGVHRIDLALWLMGHPEPQAVSGNTYDAIARERAVRERKEFSVEDLAAGIVKFRNGATLLVEASWALNIPDRERMLTELFGVGGGIVQRLAPKGWAFTSEFVRPGKDGEAEHVAINDFEGHVPSPMEEFVNAIMEEREPLATAEHGVKVQKILEGLYRSADEEREIVFP